MFHFHPRATSDLNGTGYSGSHEGLAGYGASFGASGVFGVSGVLELDAVLVLSPLVAFDLEGDPRFRSMAHHLTVSGFSLQDLLREQCEYFVVYDPCHLDALHALRVKSMLRSGQFHGLQIRHSGHPSTSMLWEMGVLPEFARTVLDRGLVPPSRWGAAKSRSRTYLKGLVQRAVNHRRPALALRLAEMALRADPADPGAMWEKVNVLRHMGRIAAADACLSEMTNRPGTLDSFLNPGFELQRLEQAQDVLALADAACDIDPSAAAAHHLRSWALERVGRLEEAIKAAATELWPTDASLRASLKSMRPAPKP